MKLWSEQTSGLVSVPYQHQQQRNHTDKAMQVLLCPPRSFSKTFPDFTIVVLHELI